MKCLSSQSTPKLCDRSTVYKTLPRTLCYTYNLMKKAMCGKLHFAHIQGVSHKHHPWMLLCRCTRSEFPGSQTSYSDRRGRRDTLRLWDWWTEALWGAKGETKQLCCWNWEKPSARRLWETLWLPLPHSWQIQGNKTNRTWSRMPVNWVQLFIHEDGTLHLTVDFKAETSQIWAYRQMK